MPICFFRQTSCIKATSFTWADPGFLERRFICIHHCKCVGSLCRFYLIFLKYPIKMRQNYSILIGYLKAGGGFKQTPWTPSGPATALLAYMLTVSMVSRVVGLAKPSDRCLSVCLISSETMILWIVATNRLDLHGYRKGLWPFKAPQRRLICELRCYGSQGPPRLKCGSTQVVLDGQASDPVRVVSCVPGDGLSKARSSHSF